MAAALEDDPFVSAIKAELDRRHTSFRWLADHIGVPDATLRTWMQRRRFPAAAAMRVSQCFGWKHANAEELRREFGIDQWAHRRVRDGGASGAHLLDTFELFDRKRRRIGPTIERMNADLVDLFAAVGENDLFVFLADTVTPAEFEKFQGERLRESIALSVQRGGVFLYLRPDQAQLDTYHSPTWQLDRIPRIAEEFEAEIEWFRNTIAEILLQAGTKNAASLTRRHIVQYAVRESLFWAPGFSLGMFQTRKPATGEPIRRMTVRVPGGFGGVWYLPDYPLFAYRFCRCVAVALDEQEERLRRTRKKPAAEELDVLMRLRQIIDASDLSR